MNDMLGHNNPPSPLELLREDLDLTTGELVKARDFWLARATDLPEDVVNPTQAAVATQFAKDVGRAVRDMADAHKKAKAPYLEGGRLVDSHFKALIEPLEELGNVLRRRLTLYQRAVEAEERKRREEEAERAREAALAAEAEAFEAQREADEAEAERATQALELATHKAERAAEAAQAKPAELSRARSALGAVASLRTTLVHCDVDRQALDLEALRPYLPMDALDKAIRQAIKAGIRTIRGCRIIEESTTRIA